MFNNVMFNNVQRTLYHLEEVRNYKNNTYELFVSSNSSSQPSIPVYFHFIGYDWLFGSHSDEYAIIYDEFEMGIIIPESIFDVPGSKLTDINQIKNI